MELTKLPNIGPELARLLNEVEIRDSEELAELGAEMAFLRLKARDQTACFHKLTALEGAVQGVRKSQLTPERRTELRAFFDGLPKRQQ
ncbi:TfoX/Sxy family protein [Oscillospiraceae bacterium 50-16]